MLQFLLPVLLVLPMQSLPKVAAPPMPDFKKPVDYVQWYRDQLKFAAPDNAYLEYRLFMGGWKPRQFGTALQEQYSRLLENPRPWRPAEAPELAAWLVELEPHMTACADGTRHRYCALPSNTDARSLLEILRPGFTRSRLVTQAILLKAWQGETGLRGEQLVPHMAVVVEHANHLHQSLTVFQHLAALDIRNQLYKHIIRGTYGNHFTVTDLEEIQALLRNLDTLALNEIVTRILQFELASYYDLIQDNCRTNGALHDKFNDQKLPRWLRRFGHDPNMDLKAILKEDPKRLCKQLNKNYTELIRRCEKGVPDDLLADFTKRHDRLKKESPFLQNFLPNLDRTLEILLTAEANRRGVRIVVALAIYHKRSGKWPEKLSNPALQLGKSVVKDPFCGKDFIYRVTGESMTLYARGRDGADNKGRQPTERYQGEDGEDLVIWPVRGAKPPSVSGKTKPAASQPAQPPGAKPPEAKPAQQHDAPPPASQPAREGEPAAP